MSSVSASITRGIVYDIKNLIVKKIAPAFRSTNPGYVDGLLETNPAYAETVYYACLYFTGVFIRICVRKCRVSSKEKTMLLG